MSAPARSAEQTTAMDRAVLHNPIVVALIGLVLRCSVGLHPHGGQGSPPLYGSFEEQRHFMSVALNLPIDLWYGPNIANDKGVAHGCAADAARDFWGEGCLIYPPLAAYVSYGFGKLGESLVPGLVGLSQESQGFETQEARAFMRATVLVCDVVFVFSAAWQFCMLYYRSSKHFTIADKRGRDEAKKWQEDGQTRNGKIVSDNLNSRIDDDMRGDNPREQMKHADDDNNKIDYSERSREGADSSRRSFQGSSKALSPISTPLIDADGEAELPDTADRFVLYSRLPSSLRRRKSSTQAQTLEKANTCSGALNVNEPGVRPKYFCDAPSTTREADILQQTCQDEEQEQPDAPIALVSEVFLIILLQPAYVLVDHGYFQYSLIHVGMALWTLVLCGEGRLYHAMAVLCLSLNYNQVTYHFAPPLLIYLLAQGRSRSVCQQIVYILSLVGIGVGVFGLLWAPLCANAVDLKMCVGTIERVVHRVAALRPDSLGSPALWSVVPWMARSLRELSTTPFARFVSVLTTIIGIAPSCSDLVRHRSAPGMRRLVWALFNTSLTCVLLAMRVDRFAVLLPLMPAALLAGEVPGPSCWFSIATVFCLFPVLVEEKLGLVYVVSTSVFAATCGICFRRELFYLPLPWVEQADNADPRGIRHGIRMVDATTYLRVALMIAGGIHVFAAVSSSSVSSEGEPALWLRAHYAFSCFFLCLAWMYGNWYQWMLPTEEDQDDLSAFMDRDGDSQDCSGIHHDHQHQQRDRELAVPPKKAD